MFVLDTDHLVVLQKRSGADFANLLQRLSQYEASAFFVTIVSFHELIGGWQQYLSKATSPDGIVRGYRKLETIIGDFAKAQVLPYSDAAAHIFDDLRRQQVRVATMDLRIGAVAIANRMTILTRNTVDFQRIPNLSIEDWTVT